MFAALAAAARQAGWWQMRVLGVDPGLTRCGIGAVDGAPGRPLRLAGTGLIRTPAADDIGARLLALEAELDRWLTDLEPDAVAVERVFSQRNVRTVMGTAQAGAVAIVCAARRGIPVALHTPSEVKAAVTGTGSAGKQQVTEMVSRLLRLTDPPHPADCADALALAICHLWRGTAQRRLAAAVEAAASHRGSAAGFGTAGGHEGSSPLAGPADRLGRSPGSVSAAAGAR
jgi:crossover junction endodeoxyribonuclease RuvC